jgi:amidohydrolase
VLAKLDLVAIRRDLHQHPEVAFDEHRTARVIAQHLQSLGLEPRFVATTGVVAEIEGAKPGPIVALRADTDALPILEQSGVEFASRYPGVMHACGHDMHVAILLGAAEILSQTRHELEGRIRLIFQPAEETTQGAQALVEAGIVEGVEAIFGLHNHPGLPAGKVAFRAGPLMAASDRLQITVLGKGGHAAQPHLSVDPVVAAAGILTGLQTLVSRVVDPLEPLVVSIGHLTAGSTFNVIPDTALMEGTVRYYNPALRPVLPEQLKSSVIGIAQGYRCDAEIEYLHMVPPVNNDTRLNELALGCAIELLGEENTLPAERSLGAEDFAVYQEHVPGCFFWLGSGGPHGWHHPGFTVDENALEVGARLLARIAEEAARVL